MFQSLFWWKSEIKFLCAKLTTIYMLVSILVLVEIRNQIDHKIYGARKFVRVSILVLVEIRNQIMQNIRCHRERPVSILVLVEIRNQISSGNEYSCSPE